MLIELFNITSRIKFSKWRTSMMVMERHLVIQTSLPSLHNLNRHRFTPFVPQTPGQIALNFSELQVHYLASLSFLRDTLLTPHIHQHTKLTPTPMPEKHPLSSIGLHKSALHSCHNFSFMFSSSIARILMNATSTTTKLFIETHWVLIKFRQTTHPQDISPSENAFHENEKRKWN